ncbi:MAG: DUF748 domain-containing protein, partial [Deltaproteobacteria bacterium]|nr:DUF748 domain-containing protein [Deltaproteobacteria bacterium]
IDNLTVNPLTLKVVARDVSITYPEAARDKTGEYLMRLERLEMVPALRSLTLKTFVADELRLVRPRFSLTRLGDGTLSPQLFFPEGSGTPSGREEEDDFFPIVIHNITVRDGTLDVADAVHGTAYTVDAINLAVPFASTLRNDRDVALLPSLSAMVNGKTLVAAGESRPFAASRQTVFTLRTRDLNLPDFASYISPYTSLGLKSGRLHTELTLRFEADAEKAFDFSLAGTVEVTDLALTDKTETVFSAARIAVDAENVVIGPRRLFINETILEKPEVLVRRAKDGVINWETFFTLPEDLPNTDVRITSGTGAQLPVPGLPVPGSPGQKPPQGPPLQLVLKHSRVTGGKITWQDDLPGKPVRYVAENVNGSFSDVSTADQGSADFSLAFGKGPTSVTAKGRATISPMRMECSLDARSLPLAPLYPYVHEGSGLILEDGELHLAGDVVLQYRPEPLARVTRGTIALAGIKARTDRDATPLLSVGRIAAEQVTADVTRQTLRVGKITGTGINAAVTRGPDGGIVLPTFAPGPSAARPTPSAPAKASPWQITVDALSIGKSTLAFTDESLRRKASLPLTNITVTGKNFANHGNTRWTLSVAGNPGGRGKLSLSANGTLVPLDLTFSGSMDKADLRPLSPYLQETTRIRILEASLGGDFTGSIRRVPGTKTGGEFAVRGNLGVYGATLTHRGKELGGWGRMRVDNFDYRVPTTGKRSCAIERITVNNPRLAVTIDEAGVSTLQTALKRENSLAEPAEEPTPEAAKSPPAPAALSIGAVSLSLGQANYLDKRVSPPYALKVNNINATLADLSLDPATYASFTAGLMINGSPVSASGVVRSLFTRPTGNGTLSLRSLDLSRFTQYAEKYLGYPIKRGNLSASSIASLNGRELSMHNSVLIRGLDLGKKVDSPHAPELPLSAAVSLLRDSSGDITLELPVTGTLGDPEFKLGGVVGKVVATIIFKTVASPFTLVGGVLGGLMDLLTRSGPTQAEIVFPIGETTLDAVARDALEELGKELRKHPSARLEVTGVADWGEKNMLVDAWVEQALKRRKYNALPKAERAKTTPDAMAVGPEHNAREYSRLLFELYTSLPFVKKSKDPEVTSPASTRAAMRLLRARLDIGEEQLLALARSRAVAVYHALSRGNIDIAARIRLRESLLVDAEKTGDRIASYARITISR